MIATPTAPPPDVVPDYVEESESQDPVDAVNDTNQLIVEDNNPDAVRILSIDTISAAPLVVNLPPDSNWLQLWRSKKMVKGKIGLRTRLHYRTNVIAFFD